LERISSTRVTGGIKATEVKPESPGHQSHSGSEHTPRCCKLLKMRWRWKPPATVLYCQVTRIAGPANSTQKLARPGFGPAAEPPCAAPASRRHAACVAPFKCGQAARRSGFGTRALAAQLSAFAVRRTPRVIRSRPPNRHVPVPVSATSVFVMRGYLRLSVKAVR
jgi:hypothetical protein